jgi:hypothetical protein
MRLDKMTIVPTATAHKLIDIGATAWELEEGENFTDVVVDDFGITKVELEHIPCVGQGTSKTH